MELSDIGCNSYVYDCPRNRNLSGARWKFGNRVFKEIGDYTVDNGTVIRGEANPPIYNTNYISDTESAFKLIE